ncbi:MAG: CopG family transcriptional regulator [Polyangia bacterium]|jgi:predicted transcriptional regulator
MARQALNTYLEPQQKVSLERIARRRRVSQATVVREAIAEYVVRHEGESAGRPAAEAWAALLAGSYSGDGKRNDPDDIYR